ncbi:MAG: IS1182 family transposase, partial [Lysinibacillus sp.]
MFKNYNMNQLVLPLDLEMNLQKNDIAFHIHHLVESIPTEAFAPFYQETGCPSYHPKMMLKIILCGYTQSVFSGRRIEELTKDSVRMMWLAQGYEPSYRTINRFRIHPQMQELLRQCFVQFRCQLIEEQLIDQQAIFIDGTKIEANANKFTFVWKKSIEKYHASLIEKSNQLYDQLLKEQVIPVIERENTEQLSVEELGQVASTLEEVVDDYTAKIEASDDPIERKRLRSKRKSPKQILKQVNDWMIRKQKYKKDLDIMGTRNSYSKTDHDATFMRMKDDYMQNGQLKAGYNIQIATENQFTLAYDVFPNPTDTKTLTPFLDTIEENYFELPEHIVADAGYGSEANYEDVIIKRERTPLITYGMYQKEQQKKYQQDPFKTSNWLYDEESDTYTCPNDKSLTFQYHSKRTDSTGFVRQFKVYECEDCTDCPLRQYCTKASKGTNRKLSVNLKWEHQKAYVQQKLSEPETVAIYRQR